MLTLKQKLEDLDYFWHILETCFPTKEASYRMTFKSGLNWDQIKEKSRKAVKESADDLEFYRAMHQIETDFRLPGGLPFCHLGIRTPKQFIGVRKSFEGFINGDWENEKARNALGPWMEPLFTEQGKAFYAQFDEEADGIYYKGQAPEAAADEVKKAEPESNIRFDFPVPGKVAYIYVRSLLMHLIKVDRPRIYEFLRLIKDYKHLIIDFRDNGGGATDYWGKLLVAPTTLETRSIRSFMGITLGPDNERFFSDSDLVPISELPELPNAVEKEIAPLTHFMRANYEIEPDPEHRGFTGKVWVLVSDRVYSSAESFAVFCRHSGWATTVGCNTGGDGIGITPLHYAMPNSGLMWRFSGVYGINPDGSSSQVEGTTPHILCEKEKALEVCLAEIEKLYKEEN